MAKQKIQSFRQKVPLIVEQELKSVAEKKTKD
jgi:hypothetical protein